MRIQQLKDVSPESFDSDIIAAIDLAGAYIAALQPHHRRHHVGKWDSAHRKWRGYRFAWVKPADIGHTSRRNTKLLERLKKLVREGKLDIRYFGYLPAFRVAGRTKVFQDEMEH